jgi:hypothetical protein
MFAPSKNVFVKGDESPDEGGIHPTNVKIADANQQNQQGQKQNRPAEQGGSKFLVKGSSSTSVSKDWIGVLLDLDGFKDFGLFLLRIWTFGFSRTYGFRSLLIQR